MVFYGLIVLPLLLPKIARGAVAFEASFEQDDLVVTPFGVRPRECVLEVPSGSVVEETEGEAVRVTLGGKSWQHTPSPRCQNLSSSYSPASSPDPSCQNPPCTCSALPCNNWIDNAGSMNMQRYIGGMSATYLTPGTPPHDNGQTLFYFIGAENTDGTPRGGQPPPSGRAILQPVLTYSPSGWCVNSTTGWCFSSWYCCPKNLTTHSAYIIDIKPGDIFLGSFNLSKNGYFETIGRNVATGETTSLKSPRQGRNFNWADVTQEVYNVESCQDFAVGPMEFRDIRLWDTNFKDMSPDWLLTTKKPCEGKIHQHGKSFSVTHSNSEAE